MKIETIEQERFDNLTFRVETPDGTMFVSVMESTDGKPIAISLNIGKAGIAVAIWAQALARITSLALEKGGTINELISELTNLTTDRSRTSGNGEVVRSGVEGLMVGLMKYRKSKYKELTENLGGVENERGPRLAG